jgi:hypothetical protein
VPSLYRAATHIRVGEITRPSVSYVQIEDLRSALYIRQ